MARNCRFAVAVHACTVLALHSEEPVTSEFVAGSVNTNPVVVRRILSALAKAGIVRSQRGTSGGSLLAIAPAEINLLAVLRAVDEEEPPPLPHQPPNQACKVGRFIQPVLVDVLERAEAAKEQELAKTSLADIVAAVHRAAEEA